MRVAIIGAGAAGLTSAKNAKENGLDCVVYEQWSEIGGIWVYTDYTDFDQYGYPILNPMYKGLVTNLPKEIMGFADFPIPEQPKSYLTHQEILDFLNLYADNFNLKPLINFNTVVTLVKPLSDGRWEITKEDKISKLKSIDIFDSVMICVGHYHVPRIPTIPGMESFQGEQIHSKMYRHEGKYKGKVVLVVGGGVSGIDIVLQISPVAEKVIFNYHNVLLKRTYPENVIIKGCKIQKLDEYAVNFEDGSIITVDCIIYCTGYHHKYPFLHKSCGIIDGDFVLPLFKHIANINHPSMAFIGLPVYLSPFVTYDLQARFYVNYLLGIATFPSQEEMKKDLELDIAERRAKGFIGSKFHHFGDLQERYYKDLSHIGKTKSIPPVIYEIYKTAVSRYFGGFVDFKQDVYRIIDDTSFIHKIPRKY